MGAPPTAKKRRTVMSSRLRRRPRPAAASGRSRVAQRRSTAAPRGRPALVLGGAVAIVAVAAVASVVVLPLQDYVDQGAEIDRLETELSRLEDVNADLAAEVARLRTDDGIREAARDELGYVTDGESRQTLLDSSGLPSDLPDGWPYGTVAAIIDVRSSP